MKQRSRWIWILALSVVGAALVCAVPAAREAVLRAAGSALVVDEPVGMVDVVVVSLDAGGGGLLEASDLVRSGIATRVGVFTDPPSLWDHEFIRRGLPYEDEGARQVRLLKTLGVTAIEMIPRVDAGTQGEADVLPAWCAEHRIGTVVVVVSRDHSRRLRRVLDRAMKGHETKVTVRSSRYSAFDPEGWWRTRGGIRTAIIEFQKLLLDVVRHPV